MAVSGAQRRPRGARLRIERWNGYGIGESDGYWTMRKFSIRWWGPRQFPPGVPSEDVVSLLFRVATIELPADWNERMARRLLWETEYPSFHCQIER